MHRALLYSLISLVLAFAPNLAHAARPDDAANTKGFQKGDEFSVRKAMFSIFGNVDEQNRSTFEISETKHTGNAQCPGVKLISYTSTAVEWKAFTLNNVETMYLATSAVPLDDEGRNVCPSLPPDIGLHVFQKKDGRWELSLSDKNLTEAGYDGDAAVDFVKIGKDQVALAINDGASRENETARWGWMYLYSFVGDQDEILLIQSMYRDNQGACSMERGPGEVWLDLDDIRDMPEEELAALLDTCHRFKTDIYVIPSDSKFYTLKTITTDTIDWKGPDGERLTPNRLEWDYRFSEDRHKYGLTPAAPATGPMVPLFDENSNYQKRLQTLEKRARGVQ